MKTNVFIFLAFIYFQESEILLHLEEHLQLASNDTKHALHEDICGICHTPVTRLKQEAIIMVQNLDRNQSTQSGTQSTRSMDRTNSTRSSGHPGNRPQADSPIPPLQPLRGGDSPIPVSHIPTYLGGSKSIASQNMPRTTPYYSSAHHR